MGASQTQLQLGELRREYGSLYWWPALRRALSMHKAPLRVRFFECEMPGCVAAGAFHAVAATGRWSAEVEHMARCVAFAAGDDRWLLGDHALHVHLQLCAVGQQGD